MSTSDIIRAWKDPEYRSSLSPEAQALVPAHPAGLIELEDAYLDGIAGGQLPNTYGTACSLGWRCY
jgi:mersacidin/lichenicidin family type 2 lantibiotic